MKKSLLAAAALATLAVSGNAMALDTSYVRILAVDAFGVGVDGCGCGVALTLGALNFVPLGVNGAFCDYLADWSNPFNPNDVALCLVHELRTAFAPSCIINEHVDVTTTLTAGGAVSGGGLCTGFNLKGEAFADVELILTEGLVGLQGIAVFGNVGIPTIYPIRTN